jgi:hypothetical protein
VGSPPARGRSGIGHYSGEDSVTEGNAWYQRLEPTAASEAEIIVTAFRQEGIEIGGVRDPAYPAYQDDDVNPGGIAYMYAEDHILAREQYLPQVLEIIRRYSGANVGIRRVVEDIVLLTLNANGDEGVPESDGQSAESNDRNSEGGDAPTEGSGETAEGNEEGSVDERPSVLLLLDRIDEELGVGIATPDHVLTAANGEITHCPATEPEEFYGPSEPYPPDSHGDGGHRVRIFIADTGLLDNAAETFPWLHHVKGDIEPTTGPDGMIRPYAGHGTFVAGVVRCLAPGATIRVANIFRIAGSGLESDFVPRLNAAFGFGFEILHITASCLTRNNQQLIALEAWLKQLGAYKGVVCIAPAGNNHTRRPSWPGAFPGVLSVGALSTDWCGRAYFSNYGSWVDVYAPGQNLINAYASGTYKCRVYPHFGELRKFPPYSGEKATGSAAEDTGCGLARWSGTSFSTPVVTGLIAERMARCGENAQEAVAALLAGARTRAIPGVGPVLLPRREDEDGPCRDGCGRCRDGGCGHRHCGGGCGACGGDRGHCGCGGHSGGHGPRGGPRRGGNEPGRRW